MKTKLNIKAVALLMAIMILVDAAAITAIVARGSLLKYKRLAESGVVTQAQITGKRRENHQAIYYSYDVRGEAYNDVASAGVQGLDFDNVQAGQFVQLWYLPADPTTSSLSDPKKLLSQEMTALAIVSVVFPLFLAFMVVIPMETYDLLADELRVSALGFLPIISISLKDVEEVQIISWRQLWPFNRQFRFRYLVSVRLGGYFRAHAVFIRRRSGYLKNLLVTPKDPERFVKAVTERISA